ncbi:hypothetical protein QYE76_003875 [Lolium multiflorum]|uniref:Aminotransferase-like plant mobile domain-containing protein n=1 Tax=Lolium multiflorum TaxID=4521 RepID=A0AAD8RR61_LOLMU|nr:hypothetical protein QYE76_003875 [Lolium multiflorum]
MNPSAITALVDRWRPETHSFHLRTGEMTVTLQDMSMILALPIEGKPLCIDTSCEDWRGKMFDLIGKAPDEIVNKRGEKLRVSAGATFTWISQNFKTCPEGASRDLIKLYARVYVCFDRRRTKKTDWHNIHKKHVKKFVMRVEEQKKAKGIQYEEHSEDAFNQYLRWFLDNTRVQILPDAYGHEILEEPLIFDDIATLKYNKLVREGRQTSFAPMLNFVRTEIQKQAVEHETALESFPHGETGESSFREFVKRQGQKLRRLSNLLGCRDPEIMTPSQSRPWSKHYTHTAINYGFIRKTKIMKQGYPMISSQYLLVGFRLLGRESLFINFFIGSIII